MTEGYVDVDGGRLFYEEAGSGAAVVLIHPGLWDRRAWDFQFEVFAERFRTVRYDVRGHGRSSPPQGEFSSVDDLHALLTRLAVERAALVGCSKGGRITVDFTLEHPEMVGALVLVASGLSGVQESDEDREKWGPVLARIDEAAHAGETERALDLALEIWAPLGTDDPTGRRLRQIALENPQALTDEEELERPIDPPATERLREIAAPTLVVLGAKDVEDINQMWDERAPQISGSRTVVLDGADHLVAMRQPEPFNELVIEFLASGT